MTLVNFITVKKNKTAIIKNMSLLSDIYRQVGTFETLQTNVLNSARLINFSKGDNGDVLTWDESEHGWKPQAPTSGTNVYVIEENKNAEFYMTFVPELDDSVPLNTNSSVTYNPSTHVLTVPYLNGLATEAIDSLNSVNMEVKNDTTTNSALYPTFVSGNSGNQSVKVDSSGLTFNPALNTLTVANLAGNASSASSVAVTDDTSSNFNWYPTFVSVASGNQSVKVDSSGLTFNPALNTLTVANVAGNASSATNATNATNAANVAVTDDTTTNSVMYPTFVLTNSGNNNIRVDSADLTYNPVTNTFSSRLFSGSLINVVTINGAVYPPPFLSPPATGNTLTVDAVEGDDGLAQVNPYRVPFKTIKAAMASALTGNNIRVYAGSYTFTETLTMTPGVSLTGAGTQCVVLNWTSGITADSTMIVMGASCRIENVTMNMSTGSAVNITGILFPIGTSLTSKIRSSVLNVTYTGAGNKAIVGVLSNAAETYNTALFNSSDAIARSTVNVTSNSIGSTKGLSVAGKNRFGIRDSVINVNGSGAGSYVVGVETSATDAYCSLKTSTVNGASSAPSPPGINYDINRASLPLPSTILLGFTDLVNNNANSNSFSVVTESSTTTFGVFGGLPNGNLNLVPGTIDKNTNVGTFDIPIVQNMILFSGVIRFTGSLIGHTITFNVYKTSGILGPVLVFSIVMTEVTGATVIEDKKSVDFNKGDTYYAVVNSNANIPSGTFTATLAFY